MKDYWTVDAAVIYDKGLIRKNNEDAYYFDGHYARLSEMDQTASLKKKTDAMDSLWAVCDGMGGQSNGEIASHTAVSGMRDLQKHLKNKDFETVIQSWVRQASRAVTERANGGGSTLAMLYCGDQFIQTAHVGDSRIYRFHDGELTRVTKDHSKVEMLLTAGMITEEEARNHPQKGVVTRYLGMNEEYVCEATVGRKLPLMQGDRYMLCSDGVTDMMTDEEIAAVMAETGDAADCAKKLYEKVLKAGARDNLTLIVLEFTCEAEEKPALKDQIILSGDTDEENEPTEDRDAAPGDVNVQVKIMVGNKSQYEVVMEGVPSKVRMNIRQGKV